MYVPMKRKYPFWYFEYGVLYRKDDMICFKNKNGEIEIPFNQIGCVMVGPGVNLSSNVLVHAVKHKTNLCLSTSTNSISTIVSTKAIFGNPVNSWLQLEVHKSPSKNFEGAKKLLLYRFPFLHERIKLSKNVRELRGIEAAQVRKMYNKVFGKSFRRIHSDNNKKSNNFKINVANNALYNIVFVCLIEYGINPHLGFIHGKNCRNALVFDIADVIKNEDFYRMILISKDFKDLMNKTSRLLYSKKFFSRMEVILDDLYSLSKKKEASELWTSSRSSLDLVKKIEPPNNG